MNLHKSIEEIITVHPNGIKRKEIEAELQTRQMKSSTATVKRVLARLVADNRVFPEGRSVSLAYKPVAAETDPNPSAALTPISTELLNEVRSKAVAVGLPDTGRPVDLIDAVLRDWLQNSGTGSSAKTPGQVERVQWVLNYLIQHAKSGCVGPIGAKRISKEICSSNSGRKIGPTFVTRALKKLVANGELLIECDRAGSAGCIYRIPS